MKPYVIQRNGTVLDRKTRAVVGFVSRPKWDTWHGRLRWSNRPCVTTAVRREDAADVLWSEHEKAWAAAFAADAGLQPNAAPADGTDSKRRGAE